MTGPDRPRRVLLTGARAPATLELARALAAAGMDVFVADSFPPHLCRGSRAVRRSAAIPAPRHHPAACRDALLALIARWEIDLLIPTCEEIFYLAGWLSQLAPVCRVFTEPLGRLLPLHHKGVFLDTVRAAGLAVPHARLIPAGGDPRATLSDWRRAAPGRAAVFKPVFSRFAARTILIPEAAPPPAALPAAVSEDWLLQEFLTGREFSTFSVARSGRLAALAIYPRGHTAGASATIDWIASAEPAIEAWVRAFVSAYGFTGQIAFDLMLLPDGSVLPLECNPRLTSGIHLLAGAPGLAEAYLDPACNTYTAPDPGTRAMLGLAMATYGLTGAVWRGAPGDWWKAVRTSRDVVFRPRDPIPGLMQLAALAGFAWRAARRRISLTAASTWDIEWNGEPPRPEGTIP